MNNIGFGIMCFGDEYYYQGAIEKQKEIIAVGYDCYVLTDKPELFNYNTLPYDREYKSYYDKMLLPKHILKSHDICILLDADTRIIDYSFLESLKTHKFKEGISYPDVLYNHPERKRLVKELDMSSRGWRYFHDYAKSQLIDFGDLELMWEYFLVINPNGSDLKKFYQVYERLQVAKEFGELKSTEVVGCGEGISIAIASKLSGTPCQRDNELYDIIKYNIVNVSRRFTPKEKWASWMK